LIRTIHRRVGISIACFLFIQAILGMFMSVGKLASLDTSRVYSVLYAMHAGWNPLGSVYRLLLGCATCVQVSLGIMIFINRLRSRTEVTTARATPSPPDRQHALEKDVRTGALSFAADIRPLFRDMDVKAMKPNGIDLSSYEDVKKRIPDIYARLSAKEMPCDGPWGESNMRKLKMWMDSGMAP
jgi:hypothetical protein